MKVRERGVRRRGGRGTCDLFTLVGVRGQRYTMRAARNVRVQRGGRRGDEPAPVRSVVSFAMLFAIAFELSSMKGILGFAQLA